MSVTPSIRFAPPPDGQDAVEWYRDPSGAFTAGYWTGEPARFPVTYTESEFCVLLSGVVVLTDSAGHAETYRAGDCFVIPAGFAGIWETVEPVRKFYAIHQA